MLASNTMSDNPAFVARKFQDAQRLAAKGYACPLCSETFHAEPKLWEHGRTRHIKELGLSDAVAEAEIRKRFRHDAVGKAYVTTAHYTIETWIRRTYWLAQLHLVDLKMFTGTILHAGLYARLSRPCRDLHPPTMIL